MHESQLKQIIEALLFSHPGPLSIERMRMAFEEEHRPDVAQLNLILESLTADYVSKPFELIEVAEGYLMQTRSEFSPWVSRLQLERPVKYSRALLETLAIIAYKQPVTRADIEEIRGVTMSSQIMKTLLEREWIEILGYRDLPGKPALYGTSKEFLNYFNLKHINELPTLE